MVPSEAAVLDWGYTIFYLVFHTKTSNLAPHPSRDKQCISVSICQSFVSAYAQTRDAFHTLTLPSILSTIPHDQGHLVPFRNYSYHTSRLGRWLSPLLPALVRLFIALTPSSEKQSQWGDFILVHGFRGLPMLRCDAEHHGKHVCCSKAASPLGCREAEADVRSTPVAYFSQTPLPTVSVMFQECHQIMNLSRG